jgi:ubiquinol-cytochrome c reductase cytochrome c subunit
MTTEPNRRAARSKVRRKIAAGLAVGVALLAAGALYTVLVPAPQTATAQGEFDLVAQGQQLYDNHCITCHGLNLQGVPDRGPSLIGAGESAVYFQVSSGRMPLARQDAEADRKPPLHEFDVQTAEGARNIEALSQYVLANGGGPQLPKVTDETLRAGDPAKGGELFRLNCASCHNFTGQGGALSSGKSAPPLHEATERQIYAAMQTGPENMPKFSEQQLSFEEKRDIITYIDSVRGNQNNPGGNPLGSIGPVSEGLIAWLVGLAALVGVTLWLGAKV